MFKFIGGLLFLVAGLSFFFEWGVTSGALTFGLGMMAIGVVVEQRA